MLSSASAEVADDSDVMLLERMSDTMIAELGLLWSLGLCSVANVEDFRSLGVDKVCLLAADDIGSLAYDGG
jgi:hypothetical protein